MSEELSLATSCAASLNSQTTWLKSYKPCLEPIRAALSSPSDLPKQEAAFQALKPNVVKIAEFYDKSAEVASAVPKILSKLSPPDAITNDPCLALAFIELLCALNACDQAKMSTPGLQNDFSFYRRSVGKFPGDAPVSETQANQVSMWIANAAPVVTAAATTLSKDCKKDPTYAVTLTKIANMCAWITARDGGAAMEDKDKLMIAMSTAMILHDRSTGRGVFVKDTGLHLKKCVSVLAGHGSPVAVMCKNGLKYTCVHYGDASTPAFVDEYLDSIN